MEQLTDLKAILHSKRANIYYLEKCRVMQKDGRVLYLTEAKAFQNARVTYLKSIWEKDRDLKAENFFIDDSLISNALSGSSWLSVESVSRK